MILTLEQAQERCRYWQRVLRLQDWDITLAIKRRHDMKRNGAAHVWVSNTSRLAEITLLDPIDFHPDADARMRDMEDSVVHELLHLHMQDLRVPKAAEGGNLTSEEIAEERLIEAVAAALIALRRGEVYFDG